MLTSGMFTTFVATLTEDLITILPIALGVMAILWGIRLAISYFKGIAFQNSGGWDDEDIEYLKKTGQI
jgi:uncharacterized membrane protein